MHTNTTTATTTSGNVTYTSVRIINNTIFMLTANNAFKFHKMQNYVARSNNAKPDTRVSRTYNLFFLLLIWFFEVFLCLLFWRIKKMFFRFMYFFRWWWSGRSMMLLLLLLLLYRKREGYKNIAFDKYIEHECYGLFLGIFIASDWHMVNKKKYLKILWCITRGGFRIKIFEMFC